MGKTAAQHGRPTAEGEANAQPSKKRFAVGVGGAGSTVEAGESRGREAALVRVCFRSRRGFGRLA